MGTEAKALDPDVLMQELGQFRRFHLLNYLLLGLVPFALAHYAINYVFLAADVPYRCVVPECESANSSQYAAPWLEAALGGAGQQRRCERRVPLPGAARPCGAGDFTDQLQPCERWLYASNDTIVAEFNLACQEWKRTLVGTIHNVGMLVSLPIMGYVSDRWGRQRALVLSCVLMGAVGSLKAFSVSYEMYALKRVAQISGKKTALLAYHGHVSSILRYGLILWGNSIDAKKAFIKQKACIRSVFQANPLDSCKPLFKNNKILPLPCLYIFETLLFVKKNPTLFPTKKLMCPNWRGRQPNKICVPPRRLVLLSNNCFCMAVSLYNKLPESYKTMPLIKFKRIIFSILNNKNYYSVDEYMNDMKFCNV